MAHTNKISFVERSDDSARTLPRTTYETYMHHTDIASKRRDPVTRKIDKLVAYCLAAPSDQHAWHKLHTEAPKYLERLQRSSPLRHALVSTQLNLLYSQAAAGAPARLMQGPGAWSQNGQNGSAAGNWQHSERTPHSD